MNIALLFSTKERLKILRKVIYETEPLTVSKVAKQVGLSKALVSTYFKHLLDEGVLWRKKNEYRIQSSTPTKTIRILLNLSIFDTDFFSKHPFIKGVGLYGSSVKGTNTERSDIDLWIVTEDVDQETLASLTGDLIKMFGDIRPLYLTREKLELLKKTDAAFYHSLVFGSVTIHGDDIEAF
jgi:predicted transcriptional regulator